MVTLHYQEFSLHGRCSLDSSLGLTILVLGSNSAGALSLAILFAVFGKYDDTRVVGGEFPFQFFVAFEIRRTRFCLLFCQTVSVAPAFVAGPLNVCQ